MFSAAKILLLWALQWRDLTVGEIGLGQLGRIIFSADSVPTLSFLCSASMLQYLVLKIETFTFIYSVESISNCGIFMARNKSFVPFSVPWQHMPLCKIYYCGYGRNDFEITELL